MVSCPFRFSHFGKATFGCDFGEKRENGRGNKNRRKGHFNPCGGWLLNSSS
jgi:hypothetical protein